MSDGKRRSLSSTNKELVVRLLDEAFNARTLAVCDEMVATEFVELAVAPFGQDEPGRVRGACRGQGEGPRGLTANRNQENERPLPVLLEAGRDRKWSL
jgi:hypothetical protein